MEERLLSTGIKGLDLMLGGGIPENTITVVHGGPGSGKTIFSFQFLIEWLKNKERGAYFTLEEPLNRVRLDMKSIGWNIDAPEFGMLMLEDWSSFVYGESLNVSLTREILDKVKRNSIKRLVIDPLTTIVLRKRFPSDKRIEIGEMFKVLRQIDCTTIVTTEITSEGDFYMEEYLADGVIFLSQNVTPQYETIDTIRIVKMRGRRHDRQPRRYELTDKGIVVYSTEPVIFE